jgi:serine/threonine protein phosphatase PrpC
VRIAGRTHRGRVRPHNEDSVFPDTQSSPPERLDLLIVADGVGGKLAGEDASKLAVDTILRLLPTDLVKQLGTELLPQAVTAVTTDANRRIHEAAQGEERLHGMATTLTWALLRDDRAYIGHVGDSRAYLIHDGEIAQVTQDHTEAATMIETGLLTTEEAEESRWADVLTRALGDEPSVEVDFLEVELTKGDVLLLCTDGLTKHVSSEEILDVVLAAQRPELICQTLVDKANERGGTDNVSVAVVNAT